MKYKTLFRLLLKIIGVYVFVEGLAMMIGQIGLIVYYSKSGTGLASGQFWSWAVAGVLEMAIGLYLFFGGKWIVDKAIPGNRPYCHECGYDLTGAVESRCPECDTPFRMADVRPARDGGESELESADR